MTPIDPSPTVPAHSAFDPGAAARRDSGLFGLDVEPEDARVVVLGVPWDATASYRKGAHLGPGAVLAASRQIDLFDLETGRPYEAGIALVDVDPEIGVWNREASERADRVLAVGGAIEGDAALAADLARVNELGELVNERVARRTAAALDAGQLPVVLGGDHSVPFGAIRVAAERWAKKPGELGILHLDAHADLRPAFEGFTWSHASIFHNVLAHTGVAKLVQLGIRDLCEEEYEAIRASAGRVRALFDPEWARARRQGGAALEELLRGALAELPECVWLSIDIDGLDPILCPGTGTPVPGGLSWHETLWVLQELRDSGHQVVGADLCEVNPGLAAPAAAGEDTWDAIVGARLLYKMIGFALGNS